MGFASTREHECEHGELWLARDGNWYCVHCDPPRFPVEVLDRKQLQEVLTLFDPRHAALIA